MPFININNIFKKNQSTNVSGQNNIVSGEIDLDTVLGGNMHPETSMYYQAMSALKNGDVETFKKTAEAYNARLAENPNPMFQLIDISAELEKAGLSKTR